MHIHNEPPSIERVVARIVNSKAAVTAHESVSSRRKIGTRALAALPVVLLSALYALIAATWLQRGYADALVSRNGVGPFERTLTMLQASSTAVFYLILSVLMFTRRQPVRRERSIEGWALPALVVVTTAVIGRGDVNVNVPFAIKVVGSALVLTGTMFTIYALRYLGRHFGVVADVRGMVTSGPYRVVRHPLYAAETITLLGITAVVGNSLTVAAFVVSTALQIWRAKIEERALAATFPDYAQYARRTPMLVPYAAWPSRRAIEPTTAAAHGD